MAARLIRAGLRPEARQGEHPERRRTSRPRSQNVDFDPGRELLPALAVAASPASPTTSRRSTGRARDRSTTCWPTRRSRAGSTLLTEMRDTMGLILLDAGQGPRRDFTDDEFNAAIDVLQKQVDTGQIRQVHRQRLHRRTCVSGDVARRASPGPATSSSSTPRTTTSSSSLPESRRHALVGQHADPDRVAAQEERRDADQLLLRPGGRRRRSPPTSTTSARSRAPRRRWRRSTRTWPSNPLIFPTDETLAKTHVFTRPRPPTQESPTTRSSSRHGRSAPEMAEPAADADVARTCASIDVTKSFADFTAVDDLTLTIPQGSFFALLGPSGCGKTTTLRMVAGLEEPTAGRDPASATRTSPDAKPYKRPVNTVFQSYALFPHLDIFENVAFGLRRRRHARTSRRRSRRCSSWSSWPHLARRKPAQLSGGQQQRVALARALDQPARGAAARRAARRPRPQAAPADADRAQADPDRGRHHVRARHARPGGGHDHGRHHRGHERGPDRAAGRARPSSTRTRRRRSSRTSSASPTCSRAG